MIEKQEADDFDDVDDELLGSGDEPDLARLTKEMDVARRRGTKQCLSALRKLELLAEQKRTRELLSDFDDYEIDEPRVSRSQRSVA
jgi:hypothetical protein